MNINAVALLLSLLLFFKSGYANPMPRTLNIAEALKLGEAASPVLRAGFSRESQARGSLGVARSYLYPSLDLSAVDSWGFPGSTSPIPPELGGIITSPYRVGPAGGFLGRISVLDVSHWYGIAAAQEQLHTTGEQTKVIRLRVDQSVLQTYLEGARFRGEMHVWESIASKVEELERAIHGFVKNGQASEVAKLLINDQGDESRMNRLVIHERYRQSLRKLALLTATHEQEIDCIEASALNEEDLNFLRSGTISPLVSLADSDLTAAHSVALKEKAQNLPKLIAAGSAAFLSNSRLVEKQSYAGWVGVTIPVFEGFRLSSEVERARAAVDEKEDLVTAAKLEVDITNSNYDETIRTSRLELNILKNRHKAAMRAFELARHRYLAFLEPVINFRESIRNLAQIEIEINDLNAGLLLAIGSKALLNGAVVSQ